MKKLIILSLLTLIISCQIRTTKQQVNEPTEEYWKTDIENTLKLFGHRNWIVIADSAYPEQSNPSIKTITIEENHLDVIDYLSELIEESEHVNANIFIDMEMEFVLENDAPGIEKYRASLSNVLEGKPVSKKMHEVIIRELDATAKLFDVLIIKTDLAIPYTSVFFQLECGYWNAEAEGRMRNSMEMIEVQ